MGKEKSPETPVQAHHRLLKSLMMLSPGGKDLDPRPEEMDLVARVFLKAGGSWAGVFQGSVEEMGLLRKTIKLASKRGVFTKKSQWGA
jgi:hypothetical protein